MGWKIDNTREGRWGERLTTPGRGDGVEDGQHWGWVVGWKIDNTRDRGCVGRFENLIGQSKVE